jgi:anti-sigma regulatory factor (Ser/Thr protein kinase)
MEVPDVRDVGRRQAGGGKAGRKEALEIGPLFEPRGAACRRCRVTSMPRARPRPSLPTREDERTLRLQMASRRSAVAPTVDRILAAVKAAGLSRDQLHNLAVAAAEALSNAAVHGNALRPQSRVRIAILVVPHKRAEVEVKDSGQGFDFGGLSDPTDPSRILVPGGMRRLVDRVEFSDAGSRVRLVMERRLSGARRSRG